MSNSPLPPLPPSPPANGEFKNYQKTFEKEDVEIDFKSIDESFDIHLPIDWDKIDRVSVSDSGSGSNGVFFCQLNKNGKKSVFILKGSQYVADEIFPSLLSPFFGIRTPKCRLIEYHPQGFSSVYGRDWICTKNSLRRCGEHNLRVKLKVDRDLYRAFFICMEFIQGVSMCDKEFDCGKYFESKRHLRDLGKIFIFDVLINNYDRFPSVFWDHEGNSGNLLFREDCVVGIDQAVSRILRPQNKEYFQKCEDLKKEHYSSQQSPGKNPYIGRICEFIRMNTLFEISNEHKSFIWEGMNEMFQFLQKNLSKREEIMKTLKTKVKGLRTGRDWEGVYEESVQKIDIPFLSMVWKSLCK